MSARPNKAAEKTGVPLPVIVGAIVLVLLFVVWIAYRNLGPAPMGPTGPTEASKHDWMSQLAKQSGGDINKLDPADRTKIEMYVGGKERAAELIKSKYEQSK